MYQLKISAFPNGENRLVMSKLPSLCASQVTDTLDPEVGDVQGISGLVPPLTLALNSTPTDEIPKKRRQLGSFSLDARRKLLRSGGALARYDSNPLHCVFLTGTLPGGLPSAFRVMADASARIVHRLKKWIGKRYSAHSFSFYCWELQKRGALHLHYLVYVPDDDARKRILSEFRGFWIDLLRSLSDETGVDLFERANGGTHRNDTQHVQAYAQECYKSVAAYMAKYIGKQAGKYSLEYAPKRWSGVSRPLGALIKEYSKEAVKVIPSYVSARNLYLRCKEDLWDTSKVCYTYSHKVGVGDTTLVYYMDDQEEQLCQFNQVSQTMTFKPSMTGHPRRWNLEGIIFSCNLIAFPFLETLYQDSQTFLLNSSTLLESILVEAQRVPSMECLRGFSRVELKSVLTAQLRLLSNVNSATPMSSIQILYLRHLNRLHDVLKDRKSRQEQNELESLVLRKMKEVILSRKENYDRRTTKATGYLLPETRTMTGGVVAVPEVVSGQPSLFDSFP